MSLIYPLRTTDSAVQPACPYNANYSKRKNLMPNLSRRTHLATLLGSALLLAVSASAAPADAQRIARVLTQTPLIDGHNDLPWEIRARFDSDFGKVDLSRSTAGLPPPEGNSPLMTD